MNQHPLTPEELKHRMLVDVQVEQQPTEPPPPPNFDDPPPQEKNSAPEPNPERTKTGEPVQLDEDYTALEGESEAPKRYKVINGAWYAIEHDRDGAPRYKFLANWHARIIREVARDNGQDITRRMVITGKRVTGEPLPMCEVDSSAFASMNWVIQHWGSKAIMAAGQSTKDRLREAIQWESQQAEITTVYTHTGWRVIDGKRVYLTASGALGMEGIAVDLDGKLKRYALPRNPQEKNRREAIKASLAFLDVAPHQVTFALWGCMYIAPLAEITPLDFVLWVYGESGAKKSTLAALALCHYGDFDYLHLPENWESTDNILEKNTFVVKDAPLVIDDFAPKSSAVDAQIQERRAERIIRGVGNHSARNRMMADTSTKAGFVARGLVITTAENLPARQSILARLIPVEIPRDAIQKNKLTPAQKSAALYPYAMAGYLEWLANQWDTIKQHYHEWHIAIRDSLRGDYHDRTPSMFAHVLIGIRLALQYAQSENVITAAKAKELETEARTHLLTLAAAQGQIVKDETPAIRFINGIKALLASGDYYIDGNEIGQNGNAKWLGWEKGEHYYFHSDLTFTAVSEFFKKQNTVIGLTRRTLFNQLQEQGYTMTSPGRNTYRASYPQKGNFNCLAFYKNNFDTLDSD